MNNHIIPLFEDIIDGRRHGVEGALFLFEHASLAQLVFYADKLRRKLHGSNTYYVHNYHIEPTNVCVFQCKFCSFYAENKEMGWAKTHDEIIEEVRQLSDEIRELHIVGGSNPDYNLEFYSRLLSEIRSLKPDLHIKAFTASELNYFSKLSGKNIGEVLTQLKKCGLNSIPGGGAEIFDDQVRKSICPDKIGAQEWLDIHRKAHSLGIFSNATMLYGHQETVRQRFEHMELLRQLQDDTRGFRAFIPLKYRNTNNTLSNIPETDIIEDLKMFAASRLFFDNISHLKVYWPAFGKQFAMLALLSGADDLDGTIHNSTKIYSMAGAEEANPEISEDEAVKMITGTGLIPVERKYGDGQY